MATSPYRRPTQSAPSGFVADRYPRPGMYEVTYMEPTGDGSAASLIRVEFVEGAIPVELRTRLILAMQAVMLEERPTQVVEAALRLLP